jgi:hypothetical protein
VRSTQNAIQHRSAALPRTPAAIIPSFRLGNQRIKNFPLVVVQISRSVTHTSLMRQLAPTATFERAVTAGRFGHH